MHTLRKNMLALYGQAGLLWLNRLPQIVEALQIHWELDYIEAMPNLSYHFVAKALTRHRYPVVIKVGYDSNLIESEAKVLQAFEGPGMIDLLDLSLSHRALLLQRAMPGYSLKLKYPQHKEAVMNAYVDVLQKIHNPFYKQIKAPFIADWLVAIDNVQSPLIPSHLLEKALELKSYLLSSMQNVKLLHGDLHLDNILHHENEWLCIDPQGVIGELEFEMAAFNFIALEELPHFSPFELVQRIDQLAQKAERDNKRLRAWVFIRLILSAVWSVEDQSDPSIAIHLAQSLDRFT